MMYEPAGHLLIPVDTEAPQRVLRLRELGLGHAPDPEFDEFARTLAISASAPFAIVNFIDEERQYFAGLYQDGTSPDGRGTDGRGPSGTARTGGTRTGGGCRRRAGPCRATTAGARTWWSGACP